jgi:hypothetical protein
MSPAMVAAAAVAGEVDRRARPGGVMSEIVQITGRAMPVRGDDIDTDRNHAGAVPRAITFEGLEQHVFEDDRKRPRIRSTTRDTRGVDPDRQLELWLRIFPRAAHAGTPALGITRGHRRIVSPRSSSATPRSSGCHA